MEAGGLERAAGTDVLDTPAAGGLVIRGGVLRTVGYGVGIVLSVAAVAILIRHLGAADFGRYVTVISLITIVGSLAEAGLTNLGIREYSTLQGEQRDAVMRNLLGLRLAISTVGAIAALAFALAAAYSSEMVAGTAAGGLGLLLLNLQGAYSVPLSSQLILGRVAALEVVRNIVQLALTALLVALGAGLFGFLAIPVPATLAVLGLTLVWIRGAIPLTPAFDPQVWKSLLRVTASFAVATAVGTLYVYVIVLVMSLISTEDEVGYFGASFRVFVVVASIAGLLVSAAFPVLARAARDDRARLAYALQRLFEVSLIVGAGLAVLAVLGASIAIDVIAGPGFEPAVETLQVQGAAILASFLLATWGFGLISLHRHAALLGANAFALVLSIGFSLLLVPEHGALGAAITTVIGETGMAVAYAVALMRASPELRPGLAVMWKVALATAVGLGAGVAVGGSGVVAVVVAGVVYAGAVLSLRAVPDELHDFVRRRRPER